MTEIIVDNLSYQYPVSEEPALKDISFKVESGEFIGVLGSNGAGKSTLCKALVGLVPHFYKGEFSGDILLDDMNTLEHTISEIALRVGLVFQDPFNQISGAKLTVYEEMAFGLENIGLDRREMEIRIEEYMKLMGLEDQRESNPFELSGGQLQRLAIASIMALKPDVFVLDEPTSQLDPQGVDEVFRAVSRLGGQELTVIMVSQKVEKLACYADKILLLNKGKIVDFGSSAGVLSRNDLEKNGIRPPVFTRIARRLNLKNEQNEYPITAKGLKEMVVKRYEQNFSE
ncbi:MAG: energy-coupling factor ABC transporter ATP-binding protein [Halanaerobiaceae bacterium]